jgi:hypothetical protein
MFIKRILSIIVPSAVLFSGCSQKADLDFSGGAGSLDEFTDRYILAINARDTEEQRSLIHPLSFANLAELQELFIREALERSFRHSIPDERQVNIESLEAELLPFHEMVVWPVEPTHQLVIQFNTGEYSITTFVRFLREENGKWFKILPRLNESNLERYSDYRDSLESQMEAENNK